jgi:hypothetical protein
LHFLQSYRCGPQDDKREKKGRNVTPGLEKVKNPWPTPRSMNPLCCAWWLSLKRDGLSGH